MSTYKQKSIETLFKKHGVNDPDQKDKILRELTEVVYDYNMLVVKAEKEGDKYVQKQIAEDIQETENRISEIFDDVLKK